MANGIRVAIAAGILALPANVWSAERIDRTEQARALVSTFRDQQSKPGSWSLVWALGRDGKLAISEAFGEAAPGVTAVPRTIYHTGSLTKHMTAAAVLDLIDRGSTISGTGRKITLDSDVALLLDGFDHWTKPDAEPITVRRLLNMTSNLPNFTRELPADVDPWGSIESSGLLSALRTVKPFGWPGTFEYSNTSYFLLAEIVERATTPEAPEGLGYRGAMRAMFDKAGMNSSGFMGEYPAGRTVAKPHYDRKPAFIMGDWLRGSGDVASTVSDIFAWNKALMDGRIVRPELRELMFGEGGRITPTLWYGMGFFVEHKPNRDQYTHTGSVPGYSSFNGIYRRTTDGSWASVTILTNSGGLEGLDSLASDLADVLLAE